MMKWKNWNDQLSLALILLIPCLWIGSAFMNLDKQVVGATILAWGMVIQYYFRRAPTS